MDTRKLRIPLAFGLGAFFATVAFAAQDHGKLVSAKNAPTDWLTKEKAAYPADHCLVSEDKLGGEMGPPVDYVYKAEGKPDRLVRFCCKDCVKDFNKNPEKYLSELDKAAAKKAQTSKSAAPTS